MAKIKKNKSRFDVIALLSNQVGSGINMKTKVRNITHQVIEWAKEDGSRFYTTKVGERFFFDNISHTLIDLAPSKLTGSPLGAYLYSFGMITTETETKGVAAALVDYCSNKGSEVETQFFSYYNKRTNVLYIDMRNEKCNVLKICAGKEPELTFNGIDGVLFKKNDFQEIPVDCLTAKFNRGDFLRFAFDTLNFDLDASNTNKKDNMFLLENVMYSIFFAEIMEDKPLIAFYGEKGSGKTQLSRSIGKLLFGKQYDVDDIADKETKDVETMLINGRLVVGDNLDTKKKGMEDLLAKVTTGCRIARRKLYTNHDQVSVTPKCWLAVTTRKAHFTRDDVADRLLLFRMERYKEFSINSSKMHDNIEENFIEYWAEVIHNLRFIINQLEKNKNLKIPSPIRTGSFFDFVSKITDGECIELFEKVKMNQQNFMMTDNPMIEYIDRYLNGCEDEAYAPKILKGYVTGKELFEAIVKANEDVKGFNFYQTRTFMQELRDLKEQINKYYDFDYHHPSNPNQYMYQLQKKSKEEIVEEIKPPKLYKEKIRFMYELNNLELDQEEIPF